MRQSTTTSPPSLRHSDSVTFRHRGFCFFHVQPRRQQSTFPLIQVLCEDTATGLTAISATSPRIVLSRFINNSVRTIASHTVSHSKCSLHRDLSSKERRFWGQIDYLFECETVSRSGNRDLVCPKARRFAISHPVHRPMKKPESELIPADCHAATYGQTH
jgi:hypothetical protein